MDKTIEIKRDYISAMAKVIKFIRAAAEEFKDKDLYNMADVRRKGDELHLSNSNDMNDPAVYLRYDTRKLRPLKAISPQKQMEELQAAWQRQLSRTNTTADIEGDQIVIRFPSISERAFDGTRIAAHRKNIDALQMLAAQIENNAYLTRRNQERNEWDYDQLSEKGISAHLDKDGMLEAYPTHAQRAMTNRILRLSHHQAKEDILDTRAELRELLTVQRTDRGPGRA